MTDPLDDTQPHPTESPAPASPAGAGANAGANAGDAAGAGDAPAAPGPDPGTPPLRADPARPADPGWREPAWFPPRDRDRHGGPSLFSLLVGLIFIGIGAYYFLDRTLGIAMPRIHWSSLWPVGLIVIGVLILVRSIQRRA